MEKDIIYTCLSQVLDIQYKDLKHLDCNIALYDLGLSSLKLVELIVKIEETCGIEILDSDFLYENFSTIDKIFETLSKYSGRGQIKKVLILDADNVLWKGVAGEETTVIDYEVLSFHKLLDDLFNKGVLLCLCSKNQYKSIHDMFSNPQMVLREDHFVMLYTNVYDKVLCIERIAQELNLTLDSVVFADDSKYELGHVAINLTGVTCINVDYNEFDFYYNIKNIFENNYLPNNTNRTQQYREQKEREKERHNYISIKKYNESLQTEVICRRARQEDCSRLAELSHRTQQFNLSNKRYSENEIKALLEDNDYIVLCLLAKDKYGDMGIVGMSVVYKNTIEAFMISCRVFGRDFEIVLLNNIKEYFKTDLFGVYKLSEKNKIYKDFYIQNGIQSLEWYGNN